MLLMRRGRVKDRNFWLGVYNGIIITGGDAFLHSGLVIAPFLALLGAPAVIIGLVPALRIGGYFLPQLLVANRLSHLPYKLPVYNVTSGVRIGSLFLMTAAAFFLGGSNPGLTVVILLVAVTVAGQTSLQAAASIDATAEAADSAEAALGAALRIAPDVLMAPVSLDELSPGLFHRLREQLPQTSIVALGEGDGQNELERALRRGADRYLARPVREGLLSLVLARAMRKPESARRRAAADARPAAGDEAPFFEGVVGSHPVAFAFDDEGVAVMGEPVDDGCGQCGVVVEGGGPLGGRFIGSQDDGAAFVALGDDLEEEITAAYRREAKRWHPDRSGSAEAAELIAPGVPVQMRTTHGAGGPGAVADQVERFRARIATDRHRLEELS